MSAVLPVWNLPPPSVCLQGKSSVLSAVFFYIHLLVLWFVVNFCLPCPLRPGRVHILSTVTSPDLQRRTSSSSSCWPCRPSLWCSACSSCITWPGDTAAGTSPPSMYIYILYKLPLSQEKRPSETQTHHKHMVHLNSVF